MPNNQIKNLIEIVNKMHLRKIDSIQRQHFESSLQYKIEIENKEKIIESISKKNRKLEINLIKLAKNFTMQEKVEKTNVKENVISENNCNKNMELLKEYDCVHPHCGFSCKSNLDALEELKKENFNLKTAMFDLKNTNVTQHKELMTLSTRYNDLVNAFKDCQNTLFLLNSREGSAHEQTTRQATQSQNFSSKGKYVQVLLVKFQFQETLVII